MVTLYNRLNHFKIKPQIGHHSYSYDYVNNKYDLLNNLLDYVFCCTSIHSGNFSEYEEYKPQEKIESTPLIRRSPFRTAYQEEHYEPPPLPEI